MMAHHEESQPDTQPFARQVALVTGGGRGLGRAYALALAQAGMAVAVTARTESEIQATVQEIEQGGGRALAIPVDVTDASAVAQMVAAVERQLGPVNLRGPFLCARAVLPSMIARRRGAHHQRSESWRFVRP